MDDNTRTSLPASLVNGRLEGISVPDLLWNLCRRRSTGVLHLTARGITKKVYVDAGRIVFAASGDPNDRLGELLLREGVITLDQLERAISQLSSGKRLGAILVSAGHLSPDNLVRGVLAQVKGIVLGLFAWEDGDYAFHQGPLPTEEVVTLGMRTTEILLQGIRQIRSFSRIRRSVGPPSTRFRLDPGWRGVLEGLDIRDGERMLLQRLEHAGDHGASLDAMCREVFLSNYEIYQALWAFRVLGLVHEVDRANDSGGREVLEGRLERTSLPEVLIRLCRRDETGVLHVTQGSLERTLHLKEGVCVFATSNAIDDGLVAHLLRRGVISLRDREETARRLLSNKRVGTILLELGVIDEDDLRATVREQLSEIVFDTFRWSDGDFQFVAGDLPTIEDITLNRSIEELVFAGVRRVTSWSRVRDGCGGLGARLTLLSPYLSVLDKMSVGPEEWELISLMKSPKTVLEICRESVLGDFRSCQILWALRLLGAIGEAPIEVSVDTVLDGLDARPAAGDTVSAPAEDPGVAASIDEAEDVEEVPVAADPDREPEPIPLSADVDESAELISEPWRLAGERAPDDRPAATPAVLSIPDAEMSSDETLVLSHEAVDAGVPSEPEPEPDDALPRFELGEPGTGLEDMKVDMPPTAAREFDLERDAPVPEAEPEAAPAPPIETVPASAPPAELAFAEPALEASPESDVSQDPDRTSRVSREELESALASPPPALAPAPATPQVASIAAPEPEPAPTPAAPPAESWQPREGWEGAIISFNARHVVLFRAVRAEVGAGAANFVRSCRSALDESLADLFSGAELRADGSWDPEGLKRAVVEHRIDDAAGAFQLLLSAELARLQMHLGEKRAAALAEQLATIA
ncbi:MAG TPA: DUF4388 domain-containing protein [Candidatus Polarisedimenticolaceae bacterium]|nr:DUF4388 domain-containing protein [Candidatus Polarisedimenticolaceae bacterium]